jgi:glycosyltransferase 2 family protein
MRIVPLARPPLKSLLSLGFRLAVLVALLTYIVVKVSLRGIQQELAHANWPLIFLGVIFLSLQIPVAAWRWCLILRQLGSELHGMAAMRLVFVGLFLSQVLPGAAAGDPARIWLTVKEGLGLRGALNSVALDRLMMLAVLLLLAGVTILALPDWPTLQHVQWAAALLIACSLGGVALVMIADRLPASLQRWRIFRAASYLAIDARTAFLNWRTGPFLLLLSVLSYLNMSASMDLFAMALGQRTEFWAFFLVSLPIILVSILPLSIGGWGTREVTAAALFGTLGIPAPAAVLTSALYGVAATLISLPGAFFLVLTRWPKSARRLEPAEAPPSP